MNTGTHSEKRKKLSQTLNHGFTFHIYARKSKRRSRNFIYYHEDVLIFRRGRQCPLKSKDRRSNGCVAFIKGTPGGLWKRGFTSEHTRHAAIIFRTSLTE